MAKRALVLAGGGSRGAYQFGVWKALRELEITVDIVTGSSVGALNGVLIVQDEFDKAQELWENICAADVLDLPLEEGDNFMTAQGKKNILKAFLQDAVAKGGVDVSPLTKMLEDAVDEEKFRRSPMDFALVTVEYPSLKSIELAKEDIPEGLLSEYLLASAACYPALQTKEINGIQYIDGGYYDNMPINLAMRMGADEIIAVDLHGIGMVRRINSQDVPVTYIRCHWSLGPFLVFEKDLAHRNITLGYNDAMKTLGQLDGIAYTFEAGEAKENAQKLYRVSREMLAKTGLEHEEPTSPLKSLVRRILLGEIRNRRNLGEVIRVSEMLTACGELCGELFKLDPTPIYQFDAFNAEILARAATADDLLYQLLRTKVAAADTLKDIAQNLHRLDIGAVVVFLCQKIDAYLHDELPQRDLVLLSVTLPRELIAAFYLNALLATDCHHPSNATCPSVEIDIGG